MPPSEQLLYSTFLADSVGSWAWGMAVDAKGSVLVGGGAQGTDFPVTPGTFQTDCKGGWTIYLFGQDAFVALLDLRLPAADLTIVQDGVEVCFDGSSSSTPEGTSIAGYSWDFGDGAMAEGAKPPCHVYEKPGVYPIVLTVTNDIGLTSTRSQFVTVRCSSGDVPPWTASDIGTPRFPGSSEKESDCVSLCAGGKGFGGMADEGYFVYKEARGDLVLTARIEEFAGGTSGAGAGLMFRESLDPTARFAALLLEKGTARFRTRPSYVKSKATSDIPLWIRLERKGYDFIGSISTDGCAWTEVGRKTIQDFPEAMLAVIAAAGKDSGTTASSFQPIQAGICIADPPTCGTKFRRGDVSADGSTDLSDAVAILFHLFLNEPIPCDKAADSNDDSTVDISDTVFLLSYLFLGGKAPNEPLGGCGVDPMPDELTCGSSPGCQ